MKIAIALIALALGYKVFTEASKEKEGLKLLGQTVGIFVMILSLLLTLCGISMMMNCYQKDFSGFKGKCPLTGQMMMEQK